MKLLLNCAMQKINFRLKTVDFFIKDQIANFGQKSNFLFLSKNNKFS